MKKFVFTCGDINGIGPEIVIKSLNAVVSKVNRNGYYFIAPENVFKAAAELVRPRFRYNITSDFTECEPGMVNVINTGRVRITKGKANEISGRCAFEAIELSFALLKNKFADAVITAPISKSALKMGGIDYPGHTEMYADWCSADNYVMSFFSRQMNCALNSIHIPVKRIPGSVNTEKLKRNLDVLINTLQNDLHLQNPSIAVLGLNPHSGEDGLIGMEEQKIIKPLLNRSPYKKYCSGPYSPDAFFAKKLYRHYDMVFGMYHDQVLIPFKMLNFESGVNYTAGLPIIRTSPDHGTAFDIAWKNKASEKSMVDAYKFAYRIITNRRRNDRSRKNSL